MAWAQVFLRKLHRGARNQNGLAPKILNPAIATVASLRRRNLPAMAVCAFYALGKGLPPSSVLVTRSLLKNLFNPPVPAAGMGTVVTHIADKV